MSRPFNAARYARLLKGLDVTVLALSEVGHDNEKLRIDAGYFSKRFLEAQQRIEAMTHVRLGELCSTFRKGIFDIKADTYLETGIPFIRIGNLGNGLIDQRDLAFIDEATHRAEAKTAVKFGDVVLSKTAYAAAAFVDLKECNVSQDTIAVRLSAEGKRRMKSGCLVAYLCGRYGNGLMERHFQGNVQAHLSLPDGKKVPVPIFGSVLQDAADHALRTAHKQMEQAQRRMADAENALRAAVGLDSWAPREPLAFTRPASEVFRSKRLDSQYFAPRVDELIRRLGRGGLTVGGVAPARRDIFSGHGGSGEFRYIEISDVRNDGTVASTYLAQVDAPSRAKWLVHANDVVTSTVRPNRRLSAVVTSEQDGCVASSGFVVLQPSEVPPEVLLTYLRLPVFCELMDLHTSASLYPAIADKDLLALPFPTIPVSAQVAIVSGVQASHVARQRAQNLLDASREAVELAIEVSESAGLKRLTDLGHRYGD